MQTDAIEYRRFEAGVVPMWTTLRLPGQQFDEETDLFENWNRYLDATTGRYLSPEPMLQDSIRIQEAAREGKSTPTYAYARNNPIGTTDADGLWPWEYPKCRQVAYYRSEGGAMGIGGACTCRVRTIDASRATLTSTGTQRCWSISLTKASDDAEHPDGHDGKGCWQDPARNCDDVCKDEAMKQWTSVKAGGNAWGGTDELCLNPMTWGMKLLDKDMCSP